MIEHHLLRFLRYTVKKCGRIFTTFFIFSVLVSSQSISKVYADESDSSFWISNAKVSIQDAYRSVLELERAGGNVSEVVALLNTAIEYYSEAEIALESGQIDSARQLARRAVDTSNVVAENVFRLIYVVERVENEAFRNQVILSLGAISFILLFGYMGWRLFKRYYIHRMTGLKPEVASDDS